MRIGRSAGRPMVRARCKDPAIGLISALPSNSISRRSMMLIGSTPDAGSRKGANGVAQPARERESIGGACHPQRSAGVVEFPSRDADLRQDQAAASADRRSHGDQADLYAQVGGQRSDCSSRFRPRLTVPRVCEPHASLRRPIRTRRNSRP